MPPIVSRKNWGATASCRGYSKENPVSDLSRLRWQDANHSEAPFQWFASPDEPRRYTDPISTNKKPNLHLKKWARVTSRPGERSVRIHMDAHPMAPVPFQFSSPIFRTFPSKSNILEIRFSQLFSMKNGQYGLVAQLGERCVRIAAVEGTIPFESTRKQTCSMQVCFFMLPHRWLAPHSPSPRTLCRVFGSPQTIH